MGSNWENFLKNLGEWRGSFTQLSPQGEILSSTPSILNLEAFEENQLVQFRLRRYATPDYQEPPLQDYRQDYRTLGRQIIFFDTGAFSKGSFQLAPFSDFGAEFGFVHQDRRLRLVQLFDQQSQLSSLTLIREFRNGSQAQERPPLTLEQLLGTWQGQACTAYADLRSPEVTPTELSLQQQGNELEQHLHFRGQTLVDRAHIEGNRLLFTSQGQLRQILLLPDGTSCNTPLTLLLRQPFFVEVGWLLATGQRQRLIRHYDATGAWVSATLVTETKLS